MDRADGAGIGVAVAGHVLLFGLLSLGVASVTPPEPAPPPAMEVEFVESMALAPAAEPVAEASTAQAPEIGAVEELAPTPAPAPTPEVTPAPVPEPVVVAPPPVAPPAPAPRPEPVRAPPVRKVVAKPVPKPTPKPIPVKVAAKPAPAQPAPAKPTKAAPVKTAKTAPAKTAPAKTASAKAAPAKSTAPAAGKGEKNAARAPRLGKDFLAGLSDPAQPKAASESAAPAMSAKATADIGSAILRQVQPCARRQALAAPGVDRIRVTIRLQLNRDGSLAARPAVTGQTGVDDENSRYAARVNDLAVAAFTGCAPLKGLPADLYDVKRGWKTFSLRFKLPAQG